MTRDALHRFICANPMQNCINGFLLTQFVKLDMAIKIAEVDMK
jgi:hypothetical protein